MRPTEEAGERAWRIGRASGLSVLAGSLFGIVTAVVLGEFTVAAALLFGAPPITLGVLWAVEQLALRWLTETLAREAEAPRPAASSA